MKLKAGDMALEFSTEDISGQKVSLSDFNGKKVWLSFHRYAGCPICNLRVAHIKENYQEFSSKGLSIVAIFESPSQSIHQHLDRLEIPFTLVPDPERILYEKYGVENSAIGYLKGSLRIKTLYDAIIRYKFLPGKVENKMTQLPADFLINEDQTIHTAYYGKDIGDHLELQVIRGFIS